MQQPFHSFDSIDDGFTIETSRIIKKGYLSLLKNNKEIDVFVVLEEKQINLYKNEYSYENADSELEKSYISSSTLVKIDEKTFFVDSHGNKLTLKAKNKVEAHEWTEAIRRLEFSHHESFVKNREDVKTIHLK